MKCIVTHLLSALYCKSNWNPNLYSSILGHHSERLNNNHGELKCNERRKAIIPVASGVNTYEFGKPGTDLGSGFVNSHMAISFGRLYFHHHSHQCRHSVSPSTKNPTFYVANADSGNVSVVDANAYTTLMTINVQGTPTSIAVNATTNKIYVRRQSV